MNDERFKEMCYSHGYGFAYDTYFGKDVNRMRKMFFCIFDSAAGMYLDPFVAPTAEFAIREFRATVNREGHQFNLYPADYTIFSIGGFDPETGNLITQNPVSLGVGVTFVETDGQDAG